MNQPGETRARGFGREPSGDWRHRAACRGQATRYFDPWDSDDKAQLPNEVAAETCKRCPVRQPCLIAALVNDEQYGTWGGLTWRQRKSITRARNHRVRCPVCSNKLIVSDEGAYETCMACGTSWKRRLINSPTPGVPRAR